MDSITIQTTISAPIANVWEAWNKPEHITGWAFAQDDWEVPSVQNDVRVGGMFTIRMQEKSTGKGFDFIGTYTDVKEQELIEYDMDDGRHVKVEFSETSDGVRVTETFDPESQNSEEIQRAGWQSILNNFKKYVEELIH